jgi:CRP-like cAMP-binding protein
VGTTRESVNRCLNAFADRGYITIDRDAITIRNREGLRGRIY